MNGNVHRFGLNPAGRDLLVGDVHGCFSKLRAALDDVGFDPGAGDRLFSVGDLVDRGPESAQVLDWLGQPWFCATVGNHEWFALMYAAGDLHTGFYAANGGAWFIGLTPTERQPYLDAFRAMPLAVELETAAGLLGLVHADCPGSSWPDFAAALEADPSVGLLAAALESRNRAQNLFASPVAGVRAVVVGHTPVERVTSLGNVHFIDVGAWREAGADRSGFAILDAATLSSASLNSGVNSRHA